MLVYVLDPHSLDDLSHRYESGLSWLKKSVGGEPLKSILSRIISRLFTPKKEMVGNFGNTEAPGFTPVTTGMPPRVAPIWPLPRVGMSASDILSQFGKFDLWHYGYEFEGGPALLPSNLRRDHLTGNRRRPLQRFQHFMPYLVDALGGSLKGKRILDIACNSGFWSIQCALLGATVVGFDARSELIEQAELVKKIVGTENVDFLILPFEEMTLEKLGRFDAVLNLGILYHLPDPLAALFATKAMAETVIVVDTSLWATDEPVVHYHWEEPVDIRDAVSAGIVGYPSASALELMLRHIGIPAAYRVPIATDDMPQDYLTGERATWIGLLDRAA